MWGTSGRDTPKRTGSGNDIRAAEGAPNVAGPKAVARQRPTAPPPPPLPPTAPTDSLCLSYSIPEPAPGTSILELLGRGRADANGHGPRREGTGLGRGTGAPGVEGPRTPSWVDGGGVPLRTAIKPGPRTVGPPGPPVVGSVAGCRASHKSHRSLVGAAWAAEPALGGPTTRCARNAVCTPKPFRLPARTPLLLVCPRPVPYLQTQIACAMNGAEHTDSTPPPPQRGGGGGGRAG